MRSAVSIFPPVIEHCGNGVRIRCRAEGIESKSLWLRIQPDPGVTRVEQVADACVVPSVVAAMARGCDLHLRFPVSALLLRNLRVAIVPLLAHLHPDLFPHATGIEAEGLARTPTAGAQGSATGLSCGLDSLAATADLLGLPPSHPMALRSLGFFDVGNHDPLHTGDAEHLFAERLSKARACASDIGLPLFDVESNLQEWFPGVFARLHTLRNASAALLLAPLVRHYVYASAVPVWMTKLSPADSAYGDAVLLPLLSTEAMTFHSGTPSLDSIAKTRMISTYPPARRHLQVCLYEARNCSRCEKCLRRQLALDVAGGLQHFQKVFDLRQFFRARSWYIGYVLTYAAQNEPLRELATAMRAADYARYPEVTYRLRWWFHRLWRWLRRKCRRSVDRF